MTPILDKDAARRIGATQAVISRNKPGMKADTFRYLDSIGDDELARINASFPIRLTVYPDDHVPNVANGNHRICIARERGQKFVHGQIVGYGPRGGQIWSFTGRIPI